MTLNSFYTPLIPVVLPVPQGRQYYMHSFDLKKPSVPVGFMDYLNVTRQLAYAARLFAFRGVAHLTIDEKIVKSGMSQRRPGPHVDGCFIPAANKWGHEGPGPHWAHTCNNIGVSTIQRMSVIVASNVPGCKVWEGKFTGKPKSDGDLSHIREQLGEGIIVPACEAVLLSPDCVHESLIFEKDTPRTFIRLALPNKFTEGEFGNSEGIPN